MLIIRLEGEGALDLHSREFHVVQQHSIWGGPKHAKRPWSLYLSLAMTPAMTLANMALN
jgi:hypothetical protein